MRLCDIFESDPPDVVAGKLRTRTGTLLDGSSAPRRRRSPSIWRRSSASTGGEPRRPTVHPLLVDSSIRRGGRARAADDPRVRGRALVGLDLLDLIDTLAVGSHGLPLLLVTLARPEFLDAREGWGGRLSSYTSLTLGPLDERDSRELAVRRLGTTDRADAVVKIAEGDPLFMSSSPRRWGDQRRAADEHSGSSRRVWTRYRNATARYSWTLRSWGRCSGTTRCSRSAPIPTSTASSTSSSAAI